MNKKQNILVVDDEAAFLKTLKAILQREFDATIYAAESAVDGIAIAEKEKPALIICDYYMPGEDGFAFCKKIRSHPFLNDVMFIMLTGASEVSNVVNGFSIGVDDYITKPFHVEELVARVKSHLRLKALQDELREDKLELTRLNEELEKGLFGAIDLLTQLIGIRVPNAVARGRKAAHLATWMGKKLEIKDAQLHYTGIAARLHEIGKINLSDTILQKEPDEMNDIEKKAYDQFPVFGHSIVSTIPRLRTVATILRHQMENFDGTGYPDRLLREEIPLPSRIMRGVNFIEAIITQPEMTTNRMIDIVQKKRSIVLDPRVAQLLIEYIRRMDSEYWSDDKQQIGLFELREGMVIADEICTGSGVKLLNKDSVITLPIIERLLSHNGVDPILNAIYIYKNKPASKNKEKIKTQTIIE